MKGFGFGFCFGSVAYVIVVAGGGGCVKTERFPQPQHADNGFYR
jgi:hypothetical protein